MNSAVAATEQGLGNGELGALPVLEGLVGQGGTGQHMAGREVAALLGVTPPTVSKWRQGRSRMPAVKLAFLTLMLASLVEDMEAALLRQELDRSDIAALNRLRACLVVQEELNRDIPAAAMVEGSRMFRAWWDRMGRAA